ncbi:photosystem I assembly protein Ycf3 [Sporotomaculum syntrophicum]|uniref:Photosystem I assembly protein Ycf3 n=1 Tax=Sporotomaculum syntrophicum TaxID=182264 RepID=A0A9D2WQZ4_9FIRM|nr:tetratricopeptide repeat protein [Sporotomaculum syntrophicum]KAF1085965.1 photosystem I assembly protein Ycf3 [Sporotomaculum syntrophicum]
MVEKANKQSSSNSGYFANLSKKKKRQKIVFGILAFVLGVGLVASSMFWAFGDNNLPTQMADVQQTDTVEQQIAALEAQLKEEPKNTTIMVQLAKLYRDNGDGRKAVENYVKALKIKPGDVDMHKELGITYFLIGDYHQAVVQMKKAIELKPEDAYAHYYSGQFYAFRSDDGRDVARGIAELEEFIRIQKEGPDVEKAKQYIEELKAGQIK